MTPSSRAVPVEHDPAIYSIEASSDDSASIEFTLLELIQAVNEVAETERELVATVVHMVRSGRVRLTGNFRDCSVEEFGP